ncbi:MAG: T9SS type A sorting domain-containing protein [Saprospiraceae bacterium]|nr:T9SS type A sorting domain-containing protein [Saprospiraceae bacterium]
MANMNTQISVVLISRELQLPRPYPIYPNPSTDRINVDLSGMDLNNGEIVLSVFDMKGQQMIRKNIIGNGLELIDVNQLPAATYNVVVQQKDKVFQQRIIKID